MSRDILNNYELDLPVAMEDTSRLRDAQKMSELIHRRACMLEELADRRKETHEVTKEIEAEIEKLAERVRTGYEMKSVPVQEVADFDSGKIEVFRQDSGDMVSQREMSDDERQRNLV